MQLKMEELPPIPGQQEDESQKMSKGEQRSRAPERWDGNIFSVRIVKGNFITLMWFLRGSFRMGKEMSPRNISCLGVVFIL